MKFHLEGLGTLGKELDKLKGIEKPVGEALFDEALDIMTESQKRVPVLTGKLKSSGYVSPPERQGAAVFVDMNYNSEAAPYGPRIHETHKDPYKRKFLENPVKEASAGYDSRMMERIRKKL